LSEFRVVDSRTVHCANPRRDSKGESSNGGSKEVEDTPTITRRARQKEEKEGEKEIRGRRGATS